MASEIPDWIPGEVIRQPDSNEAQEYYLMIANGSVTVPGDTPGEIAENLRLLEELEQQYAQQS